MQNFLFYKLNGNSTHNPPKTETHNLKKEEKEERGMEYHQTKTTKTKRERTNGGTELPESKDKMAIGNPDTSIITLNIKGLNSPVKKGRE